jgi:hypothetical protein
VSRNVDDLVIAVKDINQELTSADDTRIIRWLNQQRRFLENESDTRIHGGLGLVTFERTLLQTIDLYSLPCDFVELVGENAIWIKAEDEGQYAAAVKVSEQDIQVWDSQDDTLNREGWIYSIRGDGMRIRPIPEASVTDGLRIIYHMAGADWVAAGAIEDIWDRWEEIIVTGAALRSGIRYEDDRTELERHHDGRLVPQFIRDFGQRDRTPQSWGRPTGSDSKSHRTGVFARTTRARRVRSR